MDTLQLAVAEAPLELAPREAANLQNKGELDPVGQFWSSRLGAEAY